MVITATPGHGSRYGKVWQVWQSAKGSGSTQRIQTLLCYGASMATPDRYRQVPVRMPEPLAAALDRLATLYGVSRSEGMRMALVRELERVGLWPPVPRDGE